MKSEQLVSAVETELKQRGMTNGAAQNRNRAAEPRVNGQRKIVEPVFVTMDSVVPEKLLGFGGIVSHLAASHLSTATQALANLF